MADLIDLDVGAMIEAARRHRGGMKNPPFDVDEYLDCLLKRRLPETVSKLQPLSMML